MTPPAQQRTWRSTTSDAQLVRLLARELSIPPLLASALARRGIRDAAAGQRFLSPSVDDLHDPFGLADMEPAADRVAHALAERETILVYGDADVDGLAATALLVQFFRTLGARPEVFVPNRAFDGYSFTDAGRRYIAEKGARVVVSVDNGITSVDPVAALAESGVDVIITDHHLPPETLPPGHAVVNPRRDDCGYPFKGLAGVGVAFKLACAVANRLHARQRAHENMRKFLGEALAWVAFGTISDVMPLVDENRALVSRGLRAIPRTTHAGLRALCAVSGIGPASDCTSEDIAFRLAPRLNAASRMGRSDLAVDLVTSTDANEACRLAAQLDELNKQRQSAEREMLSQLEPRLSDLAPDEPAVLSSDEWSTGLLGLVAGRLTRRRGVPAVLVSTSNGDPGKGSCRSIPGFDVHAALEACDDHLVEHGGHAMAAGFSIRGAAFDAFRARFLEVWERHREQGETAAPLEYEGEVPLAAITHGLVTQLDRLAPFGEGNRRPILGTMGASVVSARRMGNDQSHLELHVGQGPLSLRAVAFGRGTLADSMAPGTVVDLLFTPKMNRYRGRAQVELELVDVRAAGAAAPAAGSSS